MEKTETNEEQKNFRINIKQSAKGFCYYDVTVRADDEFQLASRLQMALDIAETACKQLNPKGDVQ